MYLSQKHGFNKSSLGLYVADYLKGVAMSLLLGTPFVWAFLKVVLWAGDSFVLWSLLLVAGFQMVVLLIFPTLQGLLALLLIS